MDRDVYAKLITKLKTLVGLKKDVEDLNGKFAMASGTLSDTVDGVVYCNYPTGFNNGNTVVIGYIAQNTNTNWYSNNKNVEVYTNADGVVIKPGTEDFCGQSCKVYLMKGD